MLLAWNTPGQKTDIGRHCNSVKIAQTGYQTTIARPERHQSNQRVNSVARVVITHIHTHTQMHTPVANTCLSPNSIQHTRGLNALFSCKHHAFFTAIVSTMYKPKKATWGLQARKYDIGRHCSIVVMAQPGDQTTNPAIVMHERYQSDQRANSMTRVVIILVHLTHTGYIFETTNDKIRKKMSIYLIVEYIHLMSIKHAT